MNILNIYRVINIYPEDDKSGHWVEAGSKKEAISIIKRWKVSAPYGRKARSTRVVQELSEDEFFILQQSLHIQEKPGKIWSEFAGTLFNTTISDWMIFQKDWRTYLSKGLRIPLDGVHARCAHCGKEFDIDSNDYENRVWLHMQKCKEKGIYDKAIKDFKEERSLA